MASDGSIPEVARSNWEVEGLNSFRQNAQGEGVFNAPDLQVGLEVRLDRCNMDEVTLRARVTNAGNLGVPAGVGLSFHQGTITAPGEVIADAETATALLPGASEIVEMIVPLPVVEGGVSFVVKVDVSTGVAVEAIGGKIRECSEDNNAAAIGGVECDLLI